MSNEVNEFESDLPGIGDISPEEMRFNWADVEAVRERIKREIVPLLQHIRDRRETLTSLWRSSCKVWDLEHEEQGYVGRANVYMPSGRKVTNTVVAQLMAGTFPGGETFNVEARFPEWAAQANDNKMILKYYVDNVAKVRSYTEIYYRQLYLTGNSPVKIFHDRKVVKTLKRARRTAPPSPFDHVLYDGPVFKPIDVNNFYLFPETVNHPSEADLVFEDMTTTIGNIKRLAMEGVYSNYAAEKISAGRRLSNKERNEADNLTKSGIPNVSDLALYGSVDITELYMDFDPHARDLENEITRVPFLITIAGGEVLRAKRNPFWHQTPPYRMGRMGTSVGRVWGSGGMEAIRNLVLLLNDQVNQGLDAATYALCPVTLTDPNLIYGALPDMEPLVQWLVKDVNNAVKFLTPPGDVINNMSVLTTGTNSWINEFGEAPPVLQGGSSPGRAFRTATGIGTAQQNARVPLQEIIRASELDVWEPMLYMFHSLIEQFADKDQIVFPDGRGGFMNLPRETLSGEWKYTWLASTQAENKVTLRAQLAEVIQMLSSPAVVGQLQQVSGKFIDLEPLIRQLIEDAYGMRNVDKILVAQMKSAIMQGIPGAGGMGGAPQPEMGGLPAGADSNLPPELLNNGDFQAVRGEADELSSLLGAFGASGTPLAPDEG